MTMIEVRNNETKEIEHFMSSHDFKKRMNMANLPESLLGFAIDQYNTKNADNNTAVIIKMKKEDIIKRYGKN